jgi:MarR family transcriptional regulator, organic hydroperoxide resistance regulator
MASEVTGKSGYPASESIGLMMRIALFGLRKSFSAQLDKHGTPWSVWYYLRVLWDSDGLSQSELIKKVGTMQPNAVTAVKTMERLGFVRIEHGETDRRRIQIWLTPKARELQKVLLPAVRAAVERAAFKNFSEAEKTTLKTLLNKVCHNIQQNEH